MASVSFPSTIVAGGGHFGSGNASPGNPQLLFTTAANQYAIVTLCAGTAAGALYLTNSSTSGGATTGANAYGFISQASGTTPVPLTVYIGPSSSAYFYSQINGTTSASWVIFQNSSPA